jgi:hypothetical protein
VAAIKQINIQKSWALSAASSLALPFKQQGKEEVNGYTTFNPTQKCHSQVARTEHT